MVVALAVMTLLGDGAWWFPAWLDRLLPSIELEGGEAEDDEPEDDEAEGAPGGNRPPQPGYVLLTTGQQAQETP